MTTTFNRQYATGERQTRSQEESEDWTPVLVVLHALLPLHEVFFPTFGFDHFYLNHCFCLESISLFSNNFSAFFKESPLSLSISPCSRWKNRVQTWSLRILHSSGVNNSLGEEHVLYIDWQDLFLRLMLKSLEMRSLLLVSNMIREWVWNWFLSFWECWGILEN